MRQAALQAAASVEDGLAQLAAGRSADDIMARAWAGSGVGGRPRRGSAAPGRRRSSYRGRSSTAAATSEAATALLLQNLESLFGVRGGAAQQIVAEIQGGPAAVPADVAADGTPSEEMLQVRPPATPAASSPPALPPPPRPCRCC